MQAFENDTQAITQLYFELSNAADLTAIEALIYPEATYSSAHTGLYYGITDIMAMMETFFNAQQGLHWHIDSIETLTEHITEVHFTCNSRDANGKAVVRTGVERIVVVDGLIRHIEVR